MDYCSGVWGFKPHNKADVVQNRAIRYFLGVHRFTPTLALNGEIGWVPCKTRRWVNILRLWNRLVKMNNSRITKKVFLFDYSYNTKSWCSDVKSILTSVNMENIYKDKLTCDVNIIERLLLSKHNETWLKGIHNVAKLRTYVTFKTEYCCENYVKLNLDKTERSFLAQLRCGILPLRIETGRFVGQKPEERVCLVCSSNSIENETHFLLKCNLYSNERQLLFRNVSIKHNQFHTFSEIDKLKMLVCEESRLCASFISTAFKKRRSMLYI